MLRSYGIAWGVLELLLTLVIIAALFGLTLFLGGRFAAERISWAVGKRQEENDWIFTTGLAPPTWYRSYQRRLDFLERLGASDTLLDRVKDRYKRRLERRLHRMLRSIERSNVIPDDKLRRTMVSNVRFVGRSWEESSWEEVTGQADDEPPAPPSTDPLT